MNTATQNAFQKRPKLLLFVGYGLATVCLVWVLHDFHIVRELRNLANVSWQWVLLGMACDVLSYGVQALRWKFLLAPFGKVRLKRSIRAVFAGLFANLVFPLRPGEVLRSYLLANSEEISIGRVLGAVGVERFVDLVIATAALAMVSLYIDLPRPDQRVADLLAYATLFLLFLVGLLILYIEIRLSKNTPVDGKKAHLPGKFMAVLTDLHAIGTSPSFYAAVLTSLAIPFCQVLGLWAVMRAYGLEPIVPGRRRGAAYHQSGGFAAECSRQRWVVSVLLRAGVEHFRRGENQRHGIFHFRLPGSDNSAGFSWFRRAAAQRDVLPCHAGEGEGSPETAARV